MLPPGVSVGQYLRFATAAMLSMLLGSQVVHNYYKPLKDLDKYVEAELEKLPEDSKQKIKMQIN